MAHYLLIESRDPYEHADAEYLADLAGDLARAGNDVTVFLVQNGVLVARPKAEAPSLRKLAGGKIKVLADDFSLRERGISTTSLAEPVRASSIDELVDVL